jgi:protein tyrosine/serine phosphatase
MGWGYDMTVKIVFALVSSLIFTAVAFAETNPIANFHIVSDGVYRGARPENAGIAYLSSLKVKTDLDLESLRPKTIADEKNAAILHSIDFINEPLLVLAGVLRVFQPDLNPEEMETITKLVGDPANYPIFVHCERGEDRTGLVIGLYRVLNQGWTPQAAWAEMLQYGYHPDYKALTQYFEQKTGWIPPTKSVVYNAFK